MSFTVYPALDIRNGRVVRLLQGDYARETQYGDDVLPRAQAARRCRCAVDASCRSGCCQSRRLHLGQHTRRDCASHRLARADRRRCALARGCGAHPRRRRRTRGDRLVGSAR
ncbi:hypothetical protein XAP6164_5500017 [Xanthomonas phaseoli pv. phaseoli]|nr:hypothetical protein XAP6164_5500017 [Xanthomonas phaseoli pv. phaseoli]